MSKRSRSGLISILKARILRFNMSPNRRIFLNIIATYGRSLYALACGLFISRWVLQALGKTDYGLYGVVGGMTVFITFLNTLLSTATSRFYAYAEGKAQKSTAEGQSAEGLEECRKWFSTAVMLHTIVPVVLTVVGYPVGLYAVEHWLTIPIDRLDACRWVFRFVCISCFVGMINVPFQAMYTAKQYIAELTIYGVAATTANIFFMYFMVTHPGDWLAKYAFWMCLVSVVPQMIICLRATKVFPECQFRLSYAWNKGRVSELTSFAFWQAFGGLGAIFRGQGIQILVNKYFGPAYNASMSIANQVAAQSQTLSSAMQGAFAPAITTACGAGRYDEMRALAYRTCKFSMLLALIFVLPLALELRTILNLWLVDPPPYTAELCWCILLMAIIDKSASGHMLAVAANGKVAAYQSFTGGSWILTLPLAWLLVAQGRGFVSIGWAMVLTMMMCSWGRVWFARKLVGMSARYWLFRIMIPVCLAALITSAAGYLLRYVMATGLARICATTLVCEVLFIALVWFYLLDEAERFYCSIRIRAFGDKVMKSLKC